MNNSQQNVEIVIDFVFIYLKNFWKENIWNSGSDICNLLNITGGFWYATVLSPESMAEAVPPRSG
jgi:hypothetical protein